MEEGEESVTTDEGSNQPEAGKRSGHSACSLAVELSTL